MKLSGKAKEDFGNYLRKLSIEHDSDFDLYPKNMLVENFSRHPFSMQWGVYVDFFNSRDIKISMQWIEDEYCYEVAVPSKNIDEEIYIISDWWIKAEEYNKDLSTCRKAAIEKANQIYNSRI